MPVPSDPDHSADGLKERMNRRLAQLHWSLVDLSERTGESYRNVHRWMREDVKIPAHFVSRFVEVVPVSAGWLVSGTGTPDPVDPSAAETALDQIARILSSVRVTSSTGIMAEQVIEGSVDGIVAFDREFRYTLWNPAMTRITGVPAEEVLGRVAFEAFPFLQDSVERQLFPRILDGESVITDQRPFRIDGRGRSGWYEAHYSPVRDAAGAVVGGLGVVRDVTGWKELVERLRESEERYRQLLELQSDPVLVQAEGEIIFANQALAELLAVDAADLPGRPVAEVVRNGGSDSGDWVEGAGLDEAGGADLRRLLRGDGTEVAVEVRSVGVAVEGRPGSQDVFRATTPV